MVDIWHRLVTRVSDTTRIDSAANRPPSGISSVGATDSRSKAVRNTMANDRHKSVLTTGQVARICNVAPRTVSKWFDSGQLRGYRIPGSKDRRIPIEQLLRFMKAHGIPTTGLDFGVIGVLIVDEDQELTAILRETLGANGEYEVTIASSAFEAGVLADKLHPRVIVVDVSLPDVAPKRIFETLRAHEDLRDTVLIAVSGAMTAGQGQGLLQDGFAGFLRKPFGIRELQDLIAQTLE